MKKYTLAVLTATVLSSSVIAMEPFELTQMQLERILQSQKYQLKNGLGDIFRES
jgi:hypothetical protein